MLFKTKPYRSIFFSSKGFNLWVIILVFLLIPSTTVAQLTNEQQIKVDLTLEKDPIKRVDLLIQLVDEYIYDQPERAVSVGLQAQSLADSISYQKGLMVSQRKLAGIYWTLADYSNAMESANQTLMIAQKLGDNLEKAGILRTMGIILKPLGENKKAVEYFFESLNLYEELKDSMGIAQVYNSIGTTFSEQGELDSAIEYFEKSLVLFRQLDDLMGISAALNNITLVLPNDSSNLEKKKSLLFEAVRINQQIGQKYWEAINYQNLGNIYLKCQMLDSAFYYLTKCKEQLETLKSMSYLADNLIIFSDYYIQLGDYDKALEYVNEALSIGQTHEIPVTIMRSLKQGAQVHLLRTDTVKAYEHTVRYHQIKDSIDEQNSYTRITHLEKLYELNKLEQERKYMHQKQIFRFVFTLIGVIVLGISIVTALIVRYRFRLKDEALKRKELNSELELKEKELTLSVMSLMKQNEILANLGVKLKNMQKNTDDDVAKAIIRSILKELKATSENEIEQELDIRFKQVHGDFYQKILKQYPDLTPNELKLCAYLRLNLSSKDISDLTGQQVSTIETARSRLRKKIGLSHSQTSLVAFLSQL